MVSICPRVQSLDWLAMVPHSEEMFSYMPLFMGESTTSITFHLAGLGPSSLSLLQSLPINFPGLQNVTIYGSSYNDITSDALSEVFLSSERLQSVCLDEPITCSVVQNLANLDHLQDLKIHIAQYIPPSQLRGFLRLRTLTVSNTPFDVVTSLVRTMGSPLQALHVQTHYSDIQASELARLFHAAEGYFLHSHLEVLNIHVSYARVDVSSFFDEHMLKPLLVFTKLWTVLLSVPCSFRIGNEMIQDMSMAWPQLDSLVLGSAGWGDDSHITPAGLVPLLRLRYLSHLSIAIDTSIVDYTLDMPLPSPNTFDSTMAYITVQDSKINDSASVAAFLSGVLPNLQRISSGISGAMTTTAASLAVEKQYMDRWNEVARLVPIIAGVR